MTETMTHEARRQLVLTVVAIALGGIVFVLTSDFMIGVGVGAAVFAIARQAMKVWVPSSGHDAGSATEPDRESAHP